MFSLERSISTTKIFQVEIKMKDQLKYLMVLVAGGFKNCFQKNLLDFKNDFLIQISNDGSGIGEHFLCNTLLHF